MHDVAHGGSAGITLTDCERLLAELRRGPLTASQAYGLGLIAHSRVSDLRRAGYRIECSRVPGERGAKSYLYSLLGAPKTQETVRVESDLGAPSKTAGEPTVESEPPVPEDSSRTAGRPAGSGAIRKDALPGGSLSPVDTPEQLTLVAV